MPDPRFMLNMPISGVQANGGVVQRAAKDLLTPVASRDNAEAPDLPKAMVDNINATSEAGRQALLTDLVGKLKSVFAPNVPGIDAEYVQGAKYYGEYALYVAKEKQGHGLMKIGHLAFSAPALLYSTLRHELIHAEQLNGKVNPGVETDKDDSAIHTVYENKEKISRKTGIPVTTITAAAYGLNTGIGKFISYCQEVETHAWEILHIFDTGGINIKVESGKRSFLDERVSELKRYFEQAADLFKAFKPAERIRFKGYADKTTALHQEALDFDAKIKNGSGSAASATAAAIKSSASSSSGSAAPVAYGAAAASFTGLSKNTDSKDVKMNSE